MSKVFSDDEISEVKARYPRLERVGTSIVEGLLDMNALYNDQALSAVFKVKITANNLNSERVPALYEIGGYTEGIAKKYNINDLRTLHRNKDGTACVCVKQVEKRKFPEGSNLMVFIEELAIPYLYELIYYEKYKQWPWGDYSHGALGLLEFYAEDTVPQTMEDISEVLVSIRKETNWKEYHKQLRKPSAERSCLCGSGIAFRKCHKRAWSGMIHLNEEFKRLGYKI